MRKITIQLSVESVKDALKQLEEYQKQINPKLDEVCRRLAEIGKAEAISIVDSIRLQDGNAVDRIDVVKIENGYKLVMEGADVYFIEFGTGNGVTPHFDTDVPVAWGTWSAEHSQMLWNKGFWYYDHMRYTGTPAYMPMYYAEKAMRDNVKRVTEEVFRK